jgi:hypothetical protein
MDCFTKWLEVYTIPNQEASTAANVLLTNFFYDFGVERELHSDQGQNFQSRLLQAVLQHLFPAVRHKSGMTCEDSLEQLIKVVLTRQKDWDKNLSLCWLTEYQHMRPQA